jgi:hypothetical protein
MVHIAKKTKDAIRARKRTPSPLYGMPDTPTIKRVKTNELKENLQEHF